MAVAIPECRPGVLRRRPGFLPRLVPGVAGLLLPESGVCGLQVPQGLLERDAGYLVEVAEVVGVFPLGQHGGGLEVGDVFVPLVPRRGAGLEGEVPYLADAAEGPGQFGGLLRGRVEAVFACLLHDLCHIEHISVYLRKDAARHAEGRSGVSSPA